MKATWLKPNLYSVKNGKIVPRSSTPVQSHNYKYIPYTPLNKPMQEDYYKQTINQLTKENAELKKTINELTIIPKQLQTFHKNEYEQKISNLSMTLVQKEKQIQFREGQFQEMDFIIFNQRNQIGHLNQVISGMNREMQELKKIISKKDEELEQKNQNILELEGKIENLISKEVQTRKNTKNSENYSQSNNNLSKSQSAQFYSLEGRSWTENQSVHKNYMTPKVKAQKNKENEKNQENEERRSSCSSELSENLKNWTQWAGQGKMSTLDFLHDSDSIDPIAGSLSGFLSTMGKK